MTRFASEAFGRELAEWVLAAVLSQERGFRRLWAEQRRRSWCQSGYSYRPLGELTVGVMGTGQMGSQGQYTRSAVIIARPGSFWAVGVLTALFML